ncbi:MAG: terpene cyclase/mutase family protein [Planctomycetes bacterium]|nr:terpene cyclase/mutase family protein [Planctomycetota bacterium]
MNRRTFLKGAALSGFAAACPRGALALQDDGAGRFQEMIPEQAEAVRKGLDFLARSQRTSGAVGTKAPVAFTSLAGLAFMAGGSTPTRGPYSENVYKALDFIMRCVSRQGYINEGGAGGHREMGGSGMHGHGYALLFLAELYGMCGELQGELANEGIKDVIQRAVKVTEFSQDPNGGWLYDPRPQGHEGSVTVTQVQALRAARNAGISIEQKVIDKGISYIRRSTTADGNIQYQLGGQGWGIRPSLTAAGACVYAYYGLYDDPMAAKCMRALYRHIANPRSNRWAGHHYYAAFYAAQACFFMKRRDAAYWTTGYDRLRKELLAAQDRRSGAWKMDPGGKDWYDESFYTSCATLVLQIPYRYLPIFQD